MDRKIRVGAVSYLNTKPLIYGFENGMMKNEIELVIDFPASIAKKLLKNEIDIGLVPVAIIPELKEHYIFSDYCISCNGEVASVCLFSDVPVEEIKIVLLDYQSNTSIRLVQMLLQEYWKVTPQYKPAGPGFQKEIKGTTAAVVIGDRAFGQKNISNYNYDLGTAWKSMTGLPFVFATWVSNVPMSADFINNFNAANAFGLQHLNEIVNNNPYPLFNLHQYYTQYIYYKFTAANRLGMKTFLEKLDEKKHI